MRLIRTITETEDNFQVEPLPGTQAGIVRHDFAKPEPEGTIVLLAFRITGYDRDCDGSAMARLEALYLSDGKLEPSGWEEDGIGIGDDTGFVVTEEELLKMLNAK